MDRSRPASTPLDRNHKIQKGTIEEQIDDPSYYQCIIGSLMYAVTGSRPDLAYAVTFLSQFNSCPNKSHFQAAKDLRLPIQLALRCDNTGSIDLAHNPKLNDLNTLTFIITSLESTLRKSLLNCSMYQVRKILRTCAPRHWTRKSTIDSMTK